MSGSAGLVDVGRRRIALAIEELSKPVLYGNIVPMAAVNGLGTLGQWLASVFLANQLGTSGYGVFSFGMSLCLLAIALSAYGMPVLLVRDTVQVGDGRLVAGSILLRILLAASIVIVGVAGVPWLGLSSGSIKMYLVFLAIPLMMAFDVSSLLDANYVARYESYLQLARRLIYLCLVVFLCAGVHVSDPFLPALAFAVSTLGFVIVQWRVVSRFATLSLKGAVRSLPAAFSLGSPLFLAAVMTNIYTYSDSLIIHWMKGSADLGVYSAAGQAYLVMVGALSLLNRVLYPTLCAAAEKREGFSVAVRRMNDIQVLAMGAAAVFLFVGAPWIIRWFFRPEYAGASPILMILACTLPILGLGSGYGRALLALGREREFSFAISLGAVANLVLNVLSIPRWGIIGAACSTLVSVCLTGAANIILYRRAVASQPPLRAPGIVRADLP